MKYFFVDDSGNEIELKVKYCEDDVMILVETEENEVAVSSDEFVSLALAELSESDCSPEQASSLASEELNKKYGTWFLEEDFSKKDIERFKNYCNEVCGSSFTYEEASTILNY